MLRRTVGQPTQVDKKVREKQSEKTMQYHNRTSNNKVVLHTVHSDDDSTDSNDSSNSNKSPALQNRPRHSTKQRMILRRGNISNPYYKKIVQARTATQARRETVTVSEKKPCPSPTIVSPLQQRKKYAAQLYQKYREKQRSIQNYNLL